MTAQIVSASSRAPLARIYYAFPWNGDLTGRPFTARFSSTRGDLWERAANADLNSDALTPSQWARIASKRNELGTRANRRGAIDAPALQASADYSSGIIRAGRRIK